MNMREISSLVQAELEAIDDPIFREKVRSYLVEPYPIERPWDYGVEGQKYTCWTVMEDFSTNTGIAYCAEGFGPTFPWGLVFLRGNHMNMGMDSAWYETLWEAFRETHTYERTAEQDAAQ